MRLHIPTYFNFSNVWSLKFTNTHNFTIIVNVNDSSSFIIFYGYRATYVWLVVILCYLEYHIEVSQRTTHEIFLPFIYLGLYPIEINFLRVNTNTQIRYFFRAVLLLQERTCFLLGLKWVRFLVHVWNIFLFHVSHILW